MARTRATARMFRPQRRPSNEDERQTLYRDRILTVDETAIPTYDFIEYASMIRKAPIDLLRQFVISLEPNQLSHIVTSYLHQFLYANKRRLKKVSRIDNEILSSIRTIIKPTIIEMDRKERRKEGNNLLLSLPQHLYGVINSFLSYSERCNCERINIHYLRMARGLPMSIHHAVFNNRYVTASFRFAFKNRIFTSVQSLQISAHSYGYFFAWHKLNARLHEIIRNCDKLQSVTFDFSRWWNTRYPPFECYWLDEIGVRSNLQKVTRLKILEYDSVFSDEDLTVWRGRFKEIFPNLRHLALQSGDLKLRRAWDHTRQSNVIQFLFTAFDWLWKDSRLESVSLDVSQIAMDVMFDVHSYPLFHFHQLTNLQSLDLRLPLPNEKWNRQFQHICETVSNQISVKETRKRLPSLRDISLAIYLPTTATPTNSLFGFADAAAAPDSAAAASSSVETTMPPLTLAKEFVLEKFLRFFSRVYLVDSLRSLRLDLNLTLKGKSTINFAFDWRNHILLSPFPSPTTVSSHKLCKLINLSLGITIENTIDLLATDLGLPSLRSLQLTIYDNIVSTPHRTTVLAKLFVTIPIFLRNGCGNRLDSFGCDLRTINGGLGVTASVWWRMWIDVMTECNYCRNLKSLRLATNELVNEQLRAEAMVSAITKMMTHCHAMRNVQLSNLVIPRKAMNHLYFWFGFGLGNIDYNYQPSKKQCFISCSLYKDD